ncbi:MAG: hypothetical protein D6689_11525 [Deltaproteobacteria bacterium]|nr:MAG: hypothetical protein D6689_11525 [Deltaproteobacteria bacterium]
MAASYAIAVAAGAFGWTFAEYALHNWYGHRARGRNDFSREHLAHHARVMYFAPARKKVAGAAIMTALAAPVAVVVAGAAHGAAAVAGFLAAYIAYEWLHRRAHTHAPIGRYGRWLRKHHFYHHFGDPRHNHGVTSPLWDILFRTYTPVGRVRVPRAMAMPWLVDASGAVRPEFASDYELVGAARGTRRAA